MQRPTVDSVPAYLDHASTTPLHPVARQALFAAIDDGWADPARLYREGRRARMLLDAARETVAGVLGARADEVSFTANGTQAAHLAVLGAAKARRRAGDTLLVSAVEHSSVLHAAELHEANGGRAIRVKVDSCGRVDPAGYSPKSPGACGSHVSPGSATALARPQRANHEASRVGPAGNSPASPALASLQHANHEVGTIQPVAEVADMLHAAGVPLHVDAAMTVGRIPVDLRSLGADLLTASGHKFGGPAGVGIFVVRTGTRWVNPLPADGRELGRVPGFGNLPAVVATAAALHARAGEIGAEAPRLAGYVEQLRQRLPDLVGDVEVLGDPDPAGRLPNLVAFSCLYVDGESLLSELDRAGIAVSSGSSCTSDTLKPSHVLAAMGALTHGNVRVSFGRDSTPADVTALLEALPPAVDRVRARAGAVGL